MLLQNIVLPGVAFPIVAALVAAVISLLTARDGNAQRSGGALAVGAAFATGFVGLNGWPRLPPVEATQRLAVLIALFSLLAFVMSLFRAPEGSRKLTFAPRNRAEPVMAPLMTFVVYSTVVNLAVLEVLVRHQWSATRTTVWMLGLLAFGVAVWMALRDHLLALREPGSIYPGARDRLGRIALRLLTLSALAAVFALADSALIGQLMGAVICGIGVVDVGGWVLRRRLWRSADISLIALLLVGLALISHHYAGLSVWPALCVGAALLLLPSAHAPAWRGFLPLIFLTVAIGLLFWAKANEEPDPYDYGRLPTPGIEAPSHPGEALPAHQPVDPDGFERALQTSNIT
jgi:hypothetical protein